MARGDREEKCKKLERRQRRQQHSVTSRLVAEEIYAVLTWASSHDAFKSFFSFIFFLIYIGQWAQRLAVCSHIQISEGMLNAKRFSAADCCAGAELRKCDEHTDLKVNCVRAGQEFEAFKHWSGSSAGEFQEVFHFFSTSRVSLCIIAPELCRMGEVRAQRIQATCFIPNLVEIISNFNWMNLRLSHIFDWYLRWIRAPRGQL